MLASLLAAALIGQFVLAPPSPPPNPSPSAQAPAAAAAVPTPQGWGPPAAAAAPAAFPIQPTAQPAPLYTIVLQAAAAPQAAVPAFAPASSQFTAASSPFVVQQAQQGIGQVALIGATLIADNPWIIDRILAHWGEHLHQRGMPTLRLAPPGTVVTSPAPAPPAASSAVVALGQPGAFTVVSGPTHRTRFGRWFWGE